MKWISVKNALPKNGVKVVTYSEKTKKHNFCECLKSYVLEYGNYDEVTHWCFLPRIEKTVYVENKNCNQACPYNTLKGCNVVEKEGICPLENLNKNDNLGLLVKTNDVLARKIKEEKCNHYRKIGGIGHCTCQKLFGFCDCKGNKANCDYYEENRVQRFQVVIADDNIFVVCPIVYDKKEESDIVKYDKAEIYANQDSINTLKDLGFEKCM